MVFEVLGQNLLTLIVRSKYRGIQIDNVRLIMRQVLPLFHMYQYHRRLIEACASVYVIVWTLHSETVKSIAEFSL